jgi:hypothetical protein
MGGGFWSTPGYLYLLGVKMRKRKTAAIIVLLMFMVSSLAFSQTDLEGLQKAAGDFSDALAKSLPFNAALGLNWSDAYIGKFFPSAPPHFGVGGSFGFTTIDMAAANDLAEALGFSIPYDTKKLILPAYAGEARLGGLFLPFDVGIKAGFLPPVGLWGNSDVKTSYTMVGADIRYALTEGGVILPKISLGVGFTYLKGGLEASVGSSQVYTFPSGSVTVDSPDVNLFWSTKALDFKVQLSKSFFIITPYLGIGASYAWSEAGYEAEAPINVAGDPHTYLAANGLEDIDAGGNKLSSTIKVKGFSARAFGGLSVNLAVFKLDLTGMYNFRDSNYGLSFGARFQL